MVLLKTRAIHISDREQESVNTLPRNTCTCTVEERDMATIILSKKWISVDLKFLKDVKKTESEFHYSSFFSLLLF